MESDPGLPPEPGPPVVPEWAICRTCGNILREGASFCPDCGHPVRAGVTRPPPRLSARQILYDVQGSNSPVRRVLGFYLIWLVAGIVSVAAAGEGPAAVQVMMGIDAFTFTMTVGWAAAFRRDVFRLFRFPKGGARWLAYPALAAWPIAALISLFAGWLQQAIGAEFTYSSLFFPHGYGWGWIILLICIQPALVEELAFRGILQTTLRDTMKSWDAIVVSALAFSIMHWSLPILVPFFLFGAWLGWLRHRTESLWPAMIAHFSHNLLIVLDEHWPVLPG